MMSSLAISERDRFMEHISQQATIYVGLNDRITGVQKFDTEKCLSVIEGYDH